MLGLDLEHIAIDDGNFFQNHQISYSFCEISTNNREHPALTREFVNYTIMELLALLIINYFPDIVPCCI